MVGHMLVETASLVTVMAVVIGTLSVWLSDEGEEEKEVVDKSTEQTKLRRTRTLSAKLKTPRENVPDYKPFHSKHEESLDLSYSTATFQDSTTRSYSPVMTSRPRLRSRTMSLEEESHTETSFTTTLVHTESADASTNFIADSSTGHSATDYTLEKLEKGEQEELHDFLAGDRFLSSEDAPPETWNQKIPFTQNSPESLPWSLHSDASPTRVYKTNRSVLKGNASPQSSLETLVSQDFLSNVDLKCQEVDLSQRPLNFLSDSILLRLVHVSHLDLSHTQLSSLPDSFGALVHLEHFTASSNNLVGLPSSFGNLTNLYHLDLSKNEIPSLCKHCSVLP